MRIEDLVDEKCMALIMAGVNSVVVECRDEFVKTDEEAKKSKGVWGIVEGLGMWGTGKEKESGDKEGKLREGLEGKGEVVSAKKKEKEREREKESGSAIAPKGKEDQPFRTFPPKMVAILLPFYDFLDSNKAFATLVLHETEDGLRGF